MGLLWDVELPKIVGCEISLPGHDVLTVVRDVAAVGLERGCASCIAELTNGYQGCATEIGEQVRLACLGG